MKPYAQRIAQAALHARLLAARHQAEDRASAHAMHVYARLRMSGCLKPEARMRILAGLAGGMP